MNRLKNLLILSLLLTTQTLYSQIYNVSRRISFDGSDKEEMFRATISITSTQFIISLGSAIYFRSRIVDCKGEFSKLITLTCGNKARVIYNCNGVFNGVFVHVDNKQYYYDTHTPTPSTPPNHTPNK
jgi:hypothetical protein